MSQIAILADDFTGAMDTGVKFASRGLMTFGVFAEAVDRELPELMGSAEVIAVYSDTRGIRPDEAYDKTRRVAEKLVNWRISNIYKKVDSTLRGNIGSEIDALLDESVCEVALVAVSAPEQRRFVVNGILLVGDIPLGETEVANNSICPVKESCVPLLIQKQSKRNVAHIDLPFLAEGGSTLAMQIEQCICKGNGIITVDAITDKHLDAIVKASRVLSRQVMLVGSSGLANAMAKKLGNKKPVRLRRHFSENCILTICGSRSRISVEQIDILKSRESVRAAALNPRAISGDNRGKEISRLKKLLSSGIISGKDLILTVEDMGVQEGSERSIAASIGEIVGWILGRFRSRIGGIILIGGDTSLSVLNRLGYASIRIVMEPIPGLPLMRFLQGWLDGMLLITKAGGFGFKEDLLRAYNFLKRKGEISL